MSQMGSGSSGPLRGCFCTLGCQRPTVWYESHLLILICTRHRCMPTMLFQAAALLHMLCIAGMISCGSFSTTLHRSASSMDAVHCHCRRMCFSACLSCGTHTSHWPIRGSVVSYTITAGSVATGVVEVDLPHFDVHCGSVEIG
jgi:hypothetical protein